MLGISLIEVTSTFFRIPKQHIHFLEAFRLTLIGRKSQNEGKQLSVCPYL